jgi:hypothetical protein
MKTPAEVRKIAKEKFDSKFRMNSMYRDSALAWSLWKTAFDAGYNSAMLDAEVRLIKITDTNREALVKFKRSVRREIFDALNETSIFNEPV